MPCISVLEALELLLPELTPPEFKLASTFAFEASRSESSIVERLGIRALARRTHMAVSTVEIAMAGLLRKQLISRCRPVPNGGTAPASYRVNFLGSVPAIGTQGEPSAPGIGTQAAPSVPEFGTQATPSAPGIGTQPAPSVPAFGAQAGSVPKFGTQASEIHRYANVSENMEVSENAAESGGHVARARDIDSSRAQADRIDTLSSSLKAFPVGRLLSIRNIPVEKSEEGARLKAELIAFLKAVLPVGMPPSIPDPAAVGQCLAIAPVEDWRVLLKHLFTTGKRPERANYAWFVTVGLEKFWQVSPQETAAARAALKLAASRKRPQSESKSKTVDPQFASDLVSATAAGVKSL